MKGEHMRAQPIDLDEVLWLEDIALAILLALAEA
jgi:hypothetical protein